MIEVRYNLNMVPDKGSPIHINVSQNDDKCRTFIFKLYSSDGSWTAPASATATIEGRKDDGKFFSFACTYSNGEVTVIVQQQMVAVAGKVRCKIKLVSGAETIESAPFYFVVNPKSMPVNADMSKSDVVDAVAKATQKIVDQVAGSIPQDYVKLNEDVSGLKSDIGDVIQLSENLINLSEESAVIIDNVTPTLEFPNVGSVKITQPSRANVKIAFPINVSDDTDLTSEYVISIKSDVVLNSLARVMIVVDASTASQGTTIKPVLQHSEDYSTWSATGSFDNVKKKYIYIMLPYNIPSATFEISVKKNVDKTIKLSAIKGLGDSNFDNMTQKRLKTVDYLEKEVGKDLSEKTLIILNFEYPTGAGDVFYDARQTLLESYGFKGSFAFTEELSDNQIIRLHNLVNNGHDISIYNQSTTGRPDDVDDVSKQAEWNKYIKDIIDLANSYGVRNPVGYHCKYNKIGKALYNALLTNGFKIVRCTNGVSAGLIPGETEDSKYIKSFDKIMTVVDTAGMASSSTSGGYIYWIKQCVQNGWDFSLFGHAMEDVDKNTAVSDSVNFKKYVYVEILDYIKQCVDDGTVAVVTWQDFYNIRSKN